MEAEHEGNGYHFETLGDCSCGTQAPIVAKPPPNPLENDKECLDAFPFLADRW